MLKERNFLVYFLQNGVPDLVELCVLVFNSFVPVFLSALLGFPSLLPLLDLLDLVILLYELGLGLQILDLLQEHVRFEVLDLLVQLGKFLLHLFLLCRAGHLEHR